MYNCLGLIEPVQERLGVVEALGIWSPRSILEVVAAAAALGAASTRGPLSPQETHLVEQASVTSCIPPEGPILQSLKEAIRRGDDPLGEHAVRLRGMDARRRIGMFYTPPAIVHTMVDWALNCRPARVVEPGCGSGRFVSEVARRSPEVEILAVDVDPVATLVARAVLNVRGANRAIILNEDYTTIRLEKIPGRTAFLGNPPYVRHHALSRVQKLRGKEMAATLGLKLSGLAGLHIHFILTTYRHSSPGDVACFITSSEWLDVRYGSALREALLNGLGLLSMHLMDRNAATFPDAMTTGLITCMEIGREPRQISFQHVRSVDGLKGLVGQGTTVKTSALAGAKRWTPFFFTKRRKTSVRDLVRLGDIARVSRGTATGANSFFVISNDEASTRGLIAYTIPVLTSAKEVFEARGIIRADTIKHRMLAPSADIDLASGKHEILRSYLEYGKKLQVPDRYLCRHRALWWRVEVKRPQIVATYMARQAPAFALNPGRVAILNVIHGIFPKVSLDDEEIRGLVGYLNQHRENFRGAGRIYQGGLEKFEPGEMEDLPVPGPGAIKAFAEP